MASAAEGGAEGFGRATTRAVVVSSMMVLISDHSMNVVHVLTGKGP